MPTGRSIGCLRTVKIIYEQAGPAVLTRLAGPWRSGYGPISSPGDALVIEVTDDGAADPATSPAPAGAGSGLLGLAERLRLTGAPWSWPDGCA